MVPRNAHRSSISCFNRTETALRAQRAWNLWEPTWVSHDNLEVLEVKGWEEQETKHFMKLVQIWFRPALQREVGSKSSPYLTQSARIFLFKNIPVGCPWLQQLPPILTQAKTAAWSADAIGAHAPTCSERCLCVCVCVCFCLCVCHPMVSPRRAHALTCPWRWVDVCLWRGRVVGANGEQVGTTRQTLQNIDDSLLLEIDVKCANNVWGLAKMRGRSADAWSYGEEKLIAALGKYIGAFPRYIGYLPLGYYLSK